MNRLHLWGNTHFYEDLNQDKNETIVLVHGHPFTHTMWKYQYGVLNDFRLVLPDLKGYGKTDYKFRKIYIEEHALDLAMLLDRLDIEQVHLIGLSMGTQIIVEFARLFPHRIKSLVICAGSPRAENETSYNERLTLAEQISSEGMKAYTEQDIHKYIHPETMKEKGEVYQHLYDMMVNTEMEDAAASHRGRAERRDNFDYLNRIEVPALVIAGKEDYFFEVSDVKEVAEQIPHSSFKINEQSGHLPNMEQPDIFNSYLTEFYKENDFK
ncbi:Pimeloyl-ACP methyl ester carboxylesterase [Fodinibius roseus]|uniref:Pimeloyl-ACP methyl ester carboxylesterase n=1 Tax=Fodinibius roseus TaxID=1194090 RepID=A0A1M4YX42_9BACT|nr:alpha/beta hydrolase [Fodinibius roseus]SHF09906.1 Pimeloyl-ACP methyl ester carboxylesterase [Fodinibius roseus]